MSPVLAQKYDILKLASHRNGFFNRPCLQVKIWRRSFDVLPPAMEPYHPHYSAIREDPRYSGVAAEEFPSAESLKLTIQRTLPYWDQVSSLQYCRHAASSVLDRMIYNT